MAVPGGPYDPPWLGLKQRNATTWGNDTGKKIIKEYTEKGK